MFLAIAVDNLANAQELTAAEEAAAAEAALKVSNVSFNLFNTTKLPYYAAILAKLSGNSEEIFFLVD